jgi:alpha-glucosidase
VFSYVRVGADGQAVVVALNMSAQPQTISLDLAAAGARAATVKTLLASDDRLLAVRSSTALTLPPFASWMAAVGR